MWLPCFYYKLAQFKTIKKIGLWKVEKLFRYFVYKLLIVNCLKLSEFVFNTYMVDFVLVSIQISDGGLGMVLSFGFSDSGIPPTYSEVAYNLIQSEVDILECYWNVVKQRQKKIKCYIF